VAQKLTEAEMGTKILGAAFFLALFDFGHDRTGPLPYYFARTMPENKVEVGGWFDLGPKELA
jgi:hypothetical protein